MRWLSGVCALGLSLGASAALAKEAAPAPKAEKYVIDVSGSTEKLKLGQKGQVSLHIKPARGFKISAEAPLSIKLSTPADGVRLAKQKLGHGDADDPKSTAPVFTVPLAAQAEGAHTVTADASFFVCDASLCERKKARVAVAISVAP